MPFSSILARQPLSAVLHIVDTSALITLTQVPGSSSIQQLSHMQAVQVDGEFGVAFQHPRHAFDYIDHTVYLSSLHVSWCMYLFT